MKYLYYVIVAVVAYFIGNVNFARILSKANNKDVTKQGSGNPGTLNMWRTFGLWVGILTFLLDMIKGVIPTIVAYFVFKHFGFNAEVALYVAGLSVILGHIFPVVYKFKGGKGIATSIGVFFVANWWLALIAFAVLIIGMLFIKYASIFTLGFVLICCVGEVVLCSPANWVNYILIAGILTLIFFAHRANIKRLFEGKENKTELWRMVKGIFKKKNKQKAEQTTNIADTTNSANTNNEYK